MANIDRLIPALNGLDTTGLCTITWCINIEDYQNCHQDFSTRLVQSSLYVCMVNIKLKYNFVETPRKFIIISANNNALL